MKMQQVSDNCFAVLNEKNRVCDANSGLINQGGGVVIDTQSDLGHARQLIEMFSKVWPAMPNRVVNTHEDSDHVWGNQLFEGAEIIAHRSVPERIKKVAEPNESQKLLHGFGHFLMRMLVNATRGALGPGLVQERRSAFSLAIADRVPEKLGSRGIIAWFKVELLVKDILVYVLGRFSRGNDHGLYATIVEEIVREVKLGGSGINEWGKAMLFPHNLLPIARILSFVTLMTVFSISSVSLAVAQQPGISVLKPEEIELKAKAAWDELPDQTDTVFLDQFIEQYPNTGHAKVAFSIRYGLLKEHKSIEEYNAFLAKYPDRLITPVALNDVFELYHDANAGGGRIPDYLEFMRLYPGTPQSYLAKLHVQELMYRNVVERDNALRSRASKVQEEDELLSAYEQIIGEYDAFMEAFPDAPQSKDTITRAKNIALDYEKRYVKSDKLKRLIKESSTPKKEPVSWRANVLVVKEYSNLMDSFNKLNESQSKSEGRAILIQVERIVYLVREFYAPLGADAILTLVKEQWDEQRHKELIAKLNEIIVSNNELREDVIRELRDSSEIIVATIKSEGQMTRAAINDTKKAITDLNSKLVTIHEDLFAISGQIQETNTRLGLLHTDLQNISNSIDKMSEAMSAEHEKINVKLDALNDSVKKLARNHTSGGNRAPRFPPFPVPAPRLPTLKDVPGLPQIPMPKICPPYVADAINVVNTVSRQTNVVKDILSDPNKIANDPKAAMFRLMFEGSPVAWLEEPRLIACNPNKLSRTPIYFVNGIRNTLQDAKNIANDLSELANRPVELLHNPTALEGSTGTPGCGGTDPVGIGDLLECIYDRTWNPRVLTQLNPTTRQLAYLLYEHAKQGKPLTLVSHSGGCIISRNAILMVRLLGHSKWIDKNLTWIAAANPLNANEFDFFKPQDKTHFKQINDHNDPVPKVLGLRKWVPPFSKSNLGRHDFKENYAERVAKALGSKD